MFFSGLVVAFFSGLAETFCLRPCRDICLESCRCIFLGSCRDICLRSCRGIFFRTCRDIFFSVLTAAFFFPVLAVTSCRDNFIWSCRAPCCLRYCRDMFVSGVGGSTNSYCKTLPVCACLRIPTMSGGSFCPTVALTLPVGGRDPGSESLLSIE